MVPRRVVVDPLAGLLLSEVERLLAECEAELFAALDEDDPCGVFDLREIRLSLLATYDRLARSSTRARA